MPDMGRTQRVGWIGPAALLLSALFFQSLGLYMGTRSYVLWMDELAEPRVPPDGAQLGGERVSDFRSGSAADALASAAGHLAKGRSGGQALQDALTLADPLEEFIRSMRSSSSSGAGSDDDVGAIEVIVDLLASFVAASWLGWIVRMHDVRSWTKALIVASLLATLKGFLAWATVLPDSAGWHSCRARLGPDGLMYYRELSSGSTTGATVSLFQAWQDVILLEMRGLWLVGRATKHSVCADTIFSTVNSFTILFAISLFDALRSSTKHLEDSLETRRGWSTRRVTVLALVGAALMVVLLSQLALAVSSSYHYTLDVAIAVPLTLMVYGCTPVALASERWVLFSLEDEDDVGSPKGDDAESQALAVGSNPTSPTGPGSSAARVHKVTDLGTVTLAPCMVPFCSLGGSYFLRGEPGTPLAEPWNENIQCQHEQLAHDFKAISDESVDRLRRYQDVLEEERKRGKIRAGEASLRVDRLLADKERQLGAEEERVFAAARRRSGEEKQAALSSSEKAKAELEVLATRELELGRRRARLSDDLGQARRQARKARQVREAAPVRAADAARRAEELEALRALLKQLGADPAATEDRDGPLPKQE